MREAQGLLGGAVPHTGPQGPWTTRAACFPPGRWPFVAPFQSWAMGCAEVQLLQVQGIL